VAKQKSIGKPVQADGQAEEQRHPCSIECLSRRAMVKLCRLMAKHKSNGKPVKVGG